MRLTNKTCFLFVLSQITLLNSKTCFLCSVVTDAVFERGSVTEASRMRHGSVTEASRKRHGCVTEGGSVPSGHQHFILTTEWFFFSEMLPKLHVDHRMDFFLRNFNLTAEWICFLRNVLKITCRPQSSQHSPA